jgi:ubiquitin C-terminal hydrolase
MNSALQVLYMNPLFRQILYDLPLCENDDIKSPSSFIPQSQMYEILMALQKLFIKLEKYDIRAISTKSLTEAFEWSGSEGSVQHDSQEFIRLLFETLDNILISTPFNGVINNLFRVINYSYRTCSNCNHTNTSEEYNLEITLPVRDRNDLHDSLNSMYKSNEIINDYKCDECNQRVDLLKGSKISQLPILLNFSLMKMDYDYNTYERIKLTSRFEFPLEIDMREYMKECDGPLEDYKYELYGIIIHRGTPYQGHYFSYIRDLNKEGNWNLMKLNEFKNQPEKIEIVEEEKSESKIDLKDSTKKTESKKSNKKKNKKNSTQEEKEYERLNFDDCDHPIEYLNKDLSKNWFDFNDTSITPIRVGRIQKQFQSSESAYVLFYMKKNVSVNKVIAPVYLEKCKKYIFK